MHTTRTNKSTKRNTTTPQRKTTKNATHSTKNIATRYEFKPKEQTTNP